MGLLSVGIVYLCVRKEKKFVFFSIITFFVALRSLFLIAWTWGVILLTTNLSNELLSIDDFYSYVEISYYIVSIPFLLIVMWFGGKIILAQKHFPILRVLFLIVFVLALGGVFIIGLPIHQALYYGFA